MLGIETIFSMKYRSQKGLVKHIKNFSLHHSVRLHMHTKPHICKISLKNYMRSRLLNVAVPHLPPSLSYFTSNSCLPFLRLFLFASSYAFLIGSFSFRGVFQLRNSGFYIAMNVFQMFWIFFSVLVPFISLSSL